jgi:hypothetical protein
MLETKIISNQTAEFKSLIILKKTYNLALKMTVPEHKLTTQEARYLLYVNQMVLPVEFRELRAALAKNGFELSAVRNLPPPPSRLVFSGEIARKKETIVIADSEAGQIGIVSKSISESLGAFDELLKILQEEIGVNLLEKIKYFEIVAHYKLDTEKMPFKEIQKTENKDFVSKVSGIIGEKLSTYSIRLAKKDSTNNDYNWIDLAIEPDMVYENNYHIGIIYRSTTKEKTEKIVDDLESNILKIAKLIEV